MPEVKVGTMTLNKVPDNYFETTEESAFCPCDLAPGIEPSPDKMLQGRLFAYADTQRYRIGPNYMQLPVNRPLVAVANNNIDGAMEASGQKGDVNYDPTDSTERPVQQSGYRYSEYPVSGMTQQKPVDKQDNFRQAGEFYRGLDKTAQDHLIKNLANDLSQIASAKIRETMASYFYRADTDYGTRVAKAINVDLAAVKTRAAQ